MKVAFVVWPGLRSGIEFSKSISPGHWGVPAPNELPDSGPSASVASPVVKTIPSVKGKETPFPEK